MSTSCTSISLLNGVEHDRGGDGAAVDVQADGRMGRHVHGGTTGFLMSRMVLFTGEPLTRVWCSMSIRFCTESSIDGERMIESTPCADSHIFPPCDFDVQPTDEHG